GATRKISGEIKSFPGHGDVEAHVYNRIVARWMTDRPFIHAIDEPVLIGISINKVARQQRAVAFSVDVHGMVIDLFLRLKLTDYIISPEDTRPPIFNRSAVMFP